MSDRPMMELQKCCAIVMFGPDTPVAGFRAGTYYQVTLDPAMVSPGGGFIRLGFHAGDEINGWQKIDGLTVVEVLGIHDGDEYSAAPRADPQQLRMNAA